LREKLISGRLSRQSFKAMDYVKKVYRKNRKLLEKGFLPETNNCMEQLFSFINDFAFQSRSFKTNGGLTSWASNLFLWLNHRSFNTGKNRGFSLLMLASNSYS